MTSELRRCLTEAVNLHMPHLPDSHEPKYKTATEAAIYADSKHAFANLLERKVKEAKAELEADLNKKLFGEPVKKVAATVPFTQEMLRDAYMKPLTEQVFRESPILSYLNNQTKEKKMSDETIAAEAVKKRKEARAADVVEIIGDFLEGAEWENGDTTSWSVKFHDTPDKTYNYVALRGGNRWYITGDGYKYSTDELVEKITTLALRGEVESPDFDL